MKTGDFPHFKTHFGSLDSKEHLDGNDMKRKKNKTCLRHRLLDVGTKHRESKRSKGPFVLSMFCLSIFCPGLHLFWCLSIRSPDKAGDPLSLERMVHGNFFFLGKVAKIMLKQKILYFLHLV